MRALSELTSPDVGETGSGLVLVVPVGSTEQHGPHLPLGTDTMIALELCSRLAKLRSDVVVAPAVAYGSSGEHEGFPGTLSIGQDALEHLLVELGRSASASFDAIVFVSGHGGNAVPIRRAVALLCKEGRAVSVFSPHVAGADPHAGRTETSLLLAIAPLLVDTKRAVPGATAPLSEMMPLLKAHGVRALSTNGVLGDPSGASSEEGERLLDEIAAVLEEHLRHVATSLKESR